MKVEITSTCNKTAGESDVLRSCSTLSRDCKGVHMRESIADVQCRISDVLVSLLSSPMPVRYVLGRCERLIKVRLTAAVKR